MAHLSDGVLRRLYDEPHAVSTAQRDHYNACARCQSRFGGVAEDARASMSLMAVPAVTVDADTALRRVRAQAEATPRRRWSPPRIRLPRISGGRGFVPATAAVLAVGIGLFAVVGAGYADSVLQLFSPKQTAVIQVHSGDVNTSLLPDLSTYGDVKVIKNPELAQADSAAAAAKTAGLPAITVGKVPGGIPTNPTFATVTQGSASFTFSGSKAQAAAAAQGKAIPAMPKNVDGSTLTVTGGPAYAIVYGYDQAIASLGAGHSGSGGPAKPSGAGTNPTGDASSPPTGAASGGSLPNIPPLLGVGAARAPVVSASNGVTARQLEDYLLSQPGISPSLAAQIRAIGDPANTLPIPIPADYATSEHVKVQGVTGTAIGDNTGLGAGVIWIKNGVVYVVAGTLSKGQVVDFANGLKIA